MEQIPSADLLLDKGRVKHLLLDYFIDGLSPGSESEQFFRSPENTADWEAVMAR